MQEINLLQNKVKDRTLQFERSNRLVLVLVTLIIILEIVAAGGLYFLTKSTQDKGVKIVQENLAIQDAMNSSQKDLELAKGLQAQLKNVNSLLQNRLYWSVFINNLSAITPAKVQYSSMSGSTSDNNVNIEGVAGSYSDVGRLMLSLTTSDKFKEVKLLSINPAEGSTFGYQFSLALEAIGEIFKK